MPWFKVDDKLHDHRKARRAQKSAMGVWVLAGSWCMDNLSDGFIPESVLSRWGTRRDAAKLVDALLWETSEKDGENGWQFRNWGAFQPSKAEIESEREATKERVRKWRETKKSNGVTNGVTNAAVTPEVQAPRPDPTRPDPSKNLSAAEPPAVDGAQTIVGEWLERCPSRPPSRVIGQASKEIKQLVTDGIHPDTIRRGVAEWSRKSLHPSAIASVVHEVQNVSPIRSVTDAQGRTILPPLPKSFFEQ